MHYRSLVAFCLTLAVASTAWAQQPASTETGTTPAAEPKPESRTRSNGVGLGPALVFWSPPKGEVGYDTSVGLALNNRNAFMFGGIVGFSWSNDIVFHDWKAMGSAYEWYFDGTRPENDTIRGLKFPVLWPGLILIPFAGANYTSGLALTVYFVPTFPAVYADIGANFTLFFRPSDRDLIADFAIGAHGLVGVDLTKNLGFTTKVLWGSPLIHSIIDGAARHVVTTTLNLNLML